MIENGCLTTDSIKEMSKVIDDPDLAREIAEYNFELGMKYFSYDTLQEKLVELIDKATAAAGA